MKSHSPISYASYPHLVEDILACSDHATKLAFRATCTSLRNQVDGLLRGSSLSLPDGVSDCRRLPYFHPDYAVSAHNRAMQLRAINSARLVLLSGMDASVEMCEAVSHIHPEASIVLNHERDEVVRLRLPEVADLTVLGSYRCCCDDVWAPGEDDAGGGDDSQLGSEEDTRHGQRFSHAARAVHIDLTLHPDQGSSHHYRCALAVAALTGGVHTLTISITEVFQLGMVLAPLQNNLNPLRRHKDFSMRVRFKGGRPEFDIQALLAGLLEMDNERIIIEDI